MFSNAIPIKAKNIEETDVEEIFYLISSCINECASNNEEYVTFKFDGVPEEVVLAMEKVLKKLQYHTFLCYHIYDADTKDSKKYWYLKVSWDIFGKKKEVLN